MAGRRAARSGRRPPACASPAAQPPASPVAGPRSPTRLPIARSAPDPSSRIRRRRRNRASSSGAGHRDSLHCNAHCRWVPASSTMTCTKPGRRGGPQACREPHCLLIAAGAAPRLGARVDLGFSGWTTGEMDLQQLSMKSQIMRSACLSPSTRSSSLLRNCPCSLRRTAARQLHE